MKADDRVANGQSTTGPIPPARSMTPDSLSYVAGSGAKVIAGVPAYLWRHGCGPTAAGMLIGYWDSHGYDWLIKGSAVTETAAVDEAIASSLGVQNNYTDYVLPMDDSTPNLLADKSEPPVGDEHVNNSIADFMKTSQSYYDNRYGWSWSSDVKPALAGYVALASSGHFKAISTETYWSNGSFNWNTLKAQIDAGHPMVLLVDSDGDGQTDHFIPVIGYDNSTGVPKYAAYNTWDTSLQWYDFGPMTNGKHWGIYGGETLAISALSLSSQTFYSMAAHDGWVLESGETTDTGATLNAANSTLILGDNPARNQYRSILSFGTGSLPDNAVITGVTLKVFKQAIVGAGDPLAGFQGLLVDVKNGSFGAGALQITDFETAADNTLGPFSPNLVANSYTINLTGARGLINKLAGASGLTQLRLRFKLDDNDDALANHLNLYSGNAGAALRPQLIITYFVP